MKNNPTVMILTYPERVRACLRILIATRLSTEEVAHATDVPLQIVEDLDGCLWNLMRPHLEKIAEQSPEEVMTMLNNYEESF